MRGVVVGLGRGLFSMSAIVIIGFFFTTAIAVRLPVILELYQTENEIVRKIEEQQKITDTLEKELQSYGTDAFVERVAREQLGFVKSSEVVFIRVDRVD